LLSGIPWYGCTTVLFDHSSVEGHLCYFWDLAVTNKTAINIHTQVLYKHKSSLLWDKFPGMQLLYHVVVTCLFFLRNYQIVFAEWLYNFTFSQAIYE